MSWLTRRLNLDQLPIPSQSARATGQQETNHHRASSRPFTLNLPQPVPTLAAISTTPSERNSQQTVSSSDSAFAAHGNENLPSDPPPAYRDVFPEGPPSSILRELLTTAPGQNDIETPLNLTLQRRQQRRELARQTFMPRSYTSQGARPRTSTDEGPAIGVDPLRFSTTKIEVPQLGAIYIVIPRNLPTPQRPLRRHQMQTSVTRPLNLAEANDDYRAPNLHQLHVPSSTPSSVGRDRPVFYIGSDDENSNQTSPVTRSDEN